MKAPLSSIASKKLLSSTPIFALLLTACGSNHQLHEPIALAAEESVTTPQSDEEAVEDAVEEIEGVHNPSEKMESIFQKFGSSVGSDSTFWHKDFRHMDFGYNLVHTKEHKSKVYCDGLNCPDKPKECRYHERRWVRISGTEYFGSMDFIVTRSDVNGKTKCNLPVKEETRRFAYYSNRRGDLTACYYLDGMILKPCTNLSQSLED